VLTRPQKVVHEGEQLRLRFILGMAPVREVEEHGEEIGGVSPVH
jgi:hypothetical protein